MPSLPSSLSAPEMLGKNSHLPRADKYREVAYHQDDQGRYVAQSYPLWRQPPPVKAPPKQRLQSKGDCSRTQPIVCAEQSFPRPGSKESSVIVQSREDRSGTKSRDIKYTKSLSPPPAPRLRRLSTPDLSDVDEERCFCDCDHDPREIAASSW
ncbi:hypothetical protein ST47_g9649 [Ascochyta rabiei]|uniref:Uncharacterized protein n=1 Tax=Didymella rabiei TaxID=5454 RepID=A0A162WUA4_DIDRA|nr:hypothetical protein ST47_g9649 [Ascochyta rabiei]